MGRGSATPFVLGGSALSGDSLWAWSASCFTILGERFQRETCSTLPLNSLQGYSLLRLKLGYD